MLLYGSQLYRPGQPLKRKRGMEKQHLMEVPPSIIAAPSPPSVPKGFAPKLTDEEVATEMMNELIAKVEKWMESNKKCLPRTRSKLCSALKSLCYLSGEINFDILFCTMLTKQLIEVSYTADLIYKKPNVESKPTLLNHSPTIASFYEEALNRICTWMQSQKEALPKTKDALQKRIQPFLIVRLSMDPEFFIQKLIDKGWIGLVGDEEGHYVYREVKLEEHQYSSSNPSEDAVDEEE